MPARIQYGSERQKCKGCGQRAIHPRAFLADIARGVGARGRLTGPVLVEGSALDCDSPAARCGKDSRRSSAEGTPHGDDRQPVEEGLEVWTCVDFSGCVVAPPGERSVGAAGVRESCVGMAASRPCGREWFQPVGVHGFH